METARQKMLARYVDYIYSEGGNYATIARKVGYVRWFLNNTKAVTQRGLRQLMQNNAVMLEGDGKNISGTAVIRDFLSFLNRGDSVSLDQENVQGLRRLADISEENMGKVNSFATWLDTEHDYSPSTVRTYITAVTQFYTHALEFTNENCKRFIRTIEENGASPKTMNIKISALEKYGEYCGQPLKLKRPKIQKSLDIDNVPTEKEYKKLCEYLENRNRLHYLWVRILATTGARVSEFIQFRWSDILSGEVTLRGKGNKWRRFFFQKEVIEECRKYLEGKPVDGPVATNRFGDIISTRGIAQLMRDWASGCGIDKRKIHPHAFRHFFAKMYIKTNRDVVQLADLLGHGSIDTTRIYLQRSYDEQKRDYNRAVTW